MLADDHYVRHLRECLPDLEVRSAVPILQGWDSYVLEVNGDLIFRFPRHTHAEPGYAREARLLVALAPALSVKVPRFEFDFSAEGQCFSRFVGYRKIPGIPLDALPMDLRPIAELARTLSELHAFPLTKVLAAGVPEADSADWRYSYERFYAWILENAFGLLDDAGRAYTQRLWEAHLSEDASFDFAPTLVHRDLGPEHILCDPETGALNGIIDWTDAALGDPAIDFAALISGISLDFAERVASHYTREISASFWDRAVFYSRLGPYHEIEYGLLTGQKQHVDAGVRSVRDASEMQLGTRPQTSVLALKKLVLQGQAVVKGRINLKHPLRGQSACHSVQA